MVKEEEISFAVDNVTAQASGASNPITVLCT